MWNLWPVVTSRARASVVPCTIGGNLGLVSLDLVDKGEAQINRCLSGGWPGRPHGGKKGGPVVFDIMPKGARPMAFLYRYEFNENFLFGSRVEKATSLNFAQSA